MDLTVSVIIPTYNRAHFLALAIESALAQTTTPHEIIVVDDVSTDGTPQLMSERYGDNPLVRYLRLDKNQGPGGAREIGVQQSTGDLIGFLDSDDTWLPSHLEVVCQTLKLYPDGVAVLTQRGQIDPDGRVTINLVRECYSGDISDVLLKRTIFHPSRLVIRKSAWLDLLRNNPTVPPPRFVEDYYQGICLVHDFGKRVHVLPDRTVWMRAHGNQSFHNARRLRDSLMTVNDLIFEAFPDLLPLQKRVRAANLYHASYFLWRAGDWQEAWRTLGDGLRSDPETITLRDFWVALSRLVIPPIAGQWLRAAKQV